jgi:chorismate mutase
MDLRTEAELVPTRSGHVNLIFSSIVATWVSTQQAAEPTVARARSEFRSHVTAAREDTDPPLEDLLGLMRQRLLLMHDVARAKWNTKTPLTDPDREKIMLRELALKGRDLGIEPQFTSAFFAAQIDAAKLLESEDFRRWETERRGPFADAPDLKRDVRPRIDAVNAKLLAALAKVQPLLRGREARVRRMAAKALEGQGMTSEVRDKAICPLTVRISKGAAKKTAL